MVRLANWCTRRWYLVLGSWLLIVVALAGVVVANGTSFTDSTELPDSESATAYRLMAQAGDAAAATDETGKIVWESSSIASAPVRAEIATLLTEVRATDGVVSVISPYAKSGAGQLNTSAGTAYALVTVAKDTDTTTIKDAVGQLRTESGLSIEMGGQAFTEDPAAGGATEAIGVIVALLLLLLVFRSFAAAVLPIVTGVAGVGVSLLAVMIASHVVDLSSSSLTMGALIGLGVGIDYALFIVNRHRKALVAGADVRSGVAQALNTSGRAVVFAGLTVIAALLGMYVIGVSILTGMAFAAAFTVLCTIAAANTLLPALLRVLGLKVLSRQQRKHLGRPAAEQQGLAWKWAGAVQARPLIATLGALIVLGTLAFPALSMRLGNADASSDPSGSASHEYYELMSKGFGDGADATLLLVGQTPDQAATKAFTSMVSALPAVPNVASAVVVAQENGVAVAALTPARSAQTAQTSDLVHTLREEVIPDAETGTGLKVYVGGSTATDIDLSDAIISKLPLYLVLIAALGFLLLVLAFRSLLVPLLGALSNLATICVGLGVIVAIFQFGWGSELLGVGSGAPIIYLVPVLIAGVIFGLSMDYQVFLVSSMHEEFHRTGDNRRAVRAGLADSAKVIVAAAAIMLAVFASFGFSGQRIVSAIGVGMAVSVLIDALVIRMTLMPALLTMIGRANWFYPRLLDAITPKLALESAPEPAAAPEPEPAGRI